MKLMEKMRQKRMGNKGFSLVELIIVIAIMAILLGIVGTQVIPYLNKAREAKDLQIINSFSTSAVTIYASHAEDFASYEGGTGTVLWCAVYGQLGSTTPSTDVVASGATQIVTATAEGGGSLTAEQTALNKIASYFISADSEMMDLVGYSSVGDLKDAMSSSKKTDIADVVVVLDFQKGVITAQAVNASGQVVFETVTSQIGTAN